MSFSLMIFLKASKLIKMKNLIFVALLSGTFMSIVGCDTLVPDDSSTAVKERQMILQDVKPQTHNERLIFESRADFDTYADHLIKNQDPSHLDEIEAEIPNFVSLRTITNQLLVDEGMANGSTQNHLRIVEDVVLESMLNHNGEIQIADSVYKITHDYVYRVGYQESDILSNYDLRTSVSTKQFHPTSVEVFEIDRSINNGALSKTNTASATHGPGECWGYFPVPDNDDRKFRMKGSLWIINWWIYRSFGTELESQQIRKRGWFRRWFHNKAEFISITGTFSIKTQNSSGQLFTGNRHYKFSKSNAAEIRHTFRRDRNNEIKGANIQATFYVLKGATHEDDSTCSSTRNWRW